MSASLAVTGAAAAAEPSGARPPTTPHPQRQTPSPGADELRWMELPLGRWRGEAYRALVLSPAEAAGDRTYPGLLLFHGLGESRRAELGLHAWRTRYGLVQNDARARREPLSLDRDERRYIRSDQLRALEDGLRRDPFAGLVYICPFTPNPHRARSPEALLDGYAEWVEQALLPSARAHAPLSPTALGVDGCSMGGFVAAEVFLRKSQLFQTLGVVQPAFGAHRVQGYAQAMARAFGAGSLRAVHLETSTLDPYRRSAEALGKELGRLGVRYDLEVLPGPHDQRWLRATGTLAMLAWHERLLGAGSQAAPERGPGAAPPR